MDGEGASDIIREGSGGERASTNNRMEMMAVIEGLHWLKLVHPDAPVTVVSDSLYVVKGVNEWRRNWRRHNWTHKVKGKGRQPIKNQTLWQHLDKLLEAIVADITFLWVKGHSGVELNEYADTRALQAAQEYA